MIYEYLAYLSPPVVSVLLLVFIAASIFIIRGIMDANSKKAVAGSADRASVIKKYSAADIYKNSPIALGIGYALTLLMMLAIFEFPTFEELELVDLSPMSLDIEEQIELPPPTEQLPPPPPKIQQPEIVEVPDDEEIEEELEIELDTEVDENQVVDIPIEFDINSTVDAPPPPEEPVDQVFEFLQDGAGYPGGEKEMANFIRKNFSFPRAARRLGVQGKVYVQFVVDKDGSVTDVKVVRGVHELLDEEAKRVVEAMPNWKPGKQRGRAVRQRMTIPIDCRLR